MIEFEDPRLRYIRKRLLLGILLAVGIMSIGFYFWYDGQQNCGVTEDGREPKPSTVYACGQVGYLMLSLPVVIGILCTINAVRVWMLYRYIKSGRFDRDLRSGTRGNETARDGRLVFVLATLPIIFLVFIMWQFTSGTVDTVFEKMIEEVDLMTWEDCDFLKEYVLSEVNRNNYIDYVDVEEKSDMQKTIIELFEKREDKALELGCITFDQRVKLP